MRPAFTTTVPSMLSRKSLQLFDEFRISDLSVLKIPERFGALEEGTLPTLLGTIILPDAENTTEAPALGGTMRLPLTVSVPLIKNT